MTDCYICGHPILEGQKTSLIHNKRELIHMNLADHLPTLQRMPAVSGISEGVTQAWKDRAGAMLTEIAREQERERAARLVEEYRLSHIGDDISELEALAQRIREGGQDESNGSGSGK